MSNTITITLTLGLDDIEAAMAKLAAIGLLNKADLSENAAEPPPAPAPAAEPPAKVNIAPAAYKWHLETHGEKLTTSMVRKLMREQGVKGSGKDEHTFTMDDIKSLFPPKANGAVAPAEEPGPVEESAPPEGVTFDDVRRATGALVKKHGRDFALGLLSEFKVNTIRDIAEADYPAYVQRVVNLAQQDEVS